MYKLASVTVLVVCLLAHSASAIVVKQENNAFTESTDWEYNALTNTIIIKTASNTETYVFWAHANGQPNTLAKIDEITRDTDLTSGTIRLKVSKTESGLTAGATDVDAITIDSAGVTSIIEGISITGDFLGTQAMTVDQVSQNVVVGNDLLNAITVNADLTGVIDINGSLTTPITINGRMDGTKAAPGIVISGSLGVGTGSIRVMQAATDANDAEVLSFSLGATPVTYTIKAEKPKEWKTDLDNNTAGFVGGGPANSGFKFDIVVEAGASA